MSDYLEAASDPRVGCIWIARSTANDPPRARPHVLEEALNAAGITTTGKEARALLEAVAAWDDPNRHLGAGAAEYLATLRADLDAAVRAIVGNLT